MPDNKTGGCPICGDARSDRYRPFCSKRCADVDLGKWMNGAYAVPAVEEDDPEAVDFQDTDLKQPDRLN